MLPLLFSLVRSCFISISYYVYGKLKNLTTNTTFTNPFRDARYDSIFENLYIPLCRFSIKLVKSKEVAEDIVQEAFVYLWENWNRLHEIEKIEAYLYKAVKNHSLSYLKRNYFAGKIIDLQHVVNSSVDYQRPGVLESIEDSELELLLENALNHLPERCRIIFSLKRFAGFTNAEIAQQLNISVKTVEAQTTIAIRKLIEYIATQSKREERILLFFLLRE